MRIVVQEAYIELCRSNVEVLLGAFCVAGRTFYLRSNFLWEATDMTTHNDFSAPNPLSETMTTWLRLRRVIEERITDPDTLALFHEFMQIDLALFEEESREAFERGRAAQRD